MSLRIYLSILILSIYSCDDDCKCPSVSYKDGKFKIDSTDFYFTHLEYTITLNDSTTIDYQFLKFREYTRVLDINVNQSRYYEIEVDTSYNGFGVKGVYNIYAGLADKDSGCYCGFKGFFDKNTPKLYFSHLPEKM